MTGRIFLMLSSFLFLYNSSFGQRKEEFRSYFRIANVAYTSDKVAKTKQLDVYMPKKGSKSQVIIWIHGGNWISGDKKDVDRKPEYFASKGYIFVSVNHRLSPDASYLGQIQDVSSAIVWVHNNILHYSGDKNKIFVMGTGTGAHLALMATLQSKFIKNASGSMDMIKGVVSFEGIGFDIPTALPVQGKQFREGCEMAIGKSKKQWIEASPVTHIKEGIETPPFMVVYSKSEAEEEGRILASKLAREKLKIKEASYPEKSGNAMLRDLGREGDKVTEEIMAFFYTCLKN